MAVFLPDAANWECLCRRCLLAESFPLTLDVALLFWVDVTIVLCSLLLGGMEASLFLLVGVVVFSMEGAATASSGDFEVVGGGIMV